ncbi:MAG: hypothetical protein V7754_23370, partial [Halioglobus sp.]
MSLIGRSSTSTTINGSNIAAGCFSYQSRLELPIRQAHHRPKTTLLYQLVEAHYPLFSAQSNAISMIKHERETDKDNKS